MEGAAGGQPRHSALSTQANAMVNNTMRSLAVDPFMPCRLPERSGTGTGGTHAWAESSTNNEHAAYLHGRGFGRCTVLRCETRKAHAIEVRSQGIPVVRRQDYENICQKLLVERVWGS
jgi:hypothetical protein